MTDARKVIKVGSRKSQLALIQTNSVVDRLKKIFPNVEFEIITMTTMGDKILDTALSKIGEKSLFTKELENGLLDKSVDFVVHSLKDLPTVLPPDLVIGAVCERDSPLDAVVMHPEHKDKTLDTLPEDSVIGTSSLRRSAQLHRRYPHLKIKDIRGNLNTRLRKLDDAGDYQALILAKAGLDRMGWENRLTHTLNEEDCLYAVSQGAMAVECRAGDSDILSYLEKLNHYETLLQVVAERAFLMKLEGGCSCPVGVFTTVEDSKLSMTGGVFSIGGDKGIKKTVSRTIPDEDEPSNKRSPRQNGPRQFAAIVAENYPQSALQIAMELGLELADQMLATEAKQILALAKKQCEEEILRQKAEKAAKLAAENGTKNTKNGVKA